MNTNFCVFVENVFLGNRVSQFHPWTRSILQKTAQWSRQHHLTPPGFPEPRPDPIFSCEKTSGVEPARLPGEQPIVTRRLQIHRADLATWIRQPIMWLHWSQPRGIVTLWVGPSPAFQDGALSTNHSEKIQKKAFMIGRLIQWNYEYSNSEPMKIMVDRNGKPCASQRKFPRPGTNLEMYLDSRFHKNSLWVLMVIVWNSIFVCLGAQFKLFLS